MVKGLHQVSPTTNEVTMKKKNNKQKIVPFDWGIDWIDNAVVDSDDDNPLSDNIRFKIIKKNK